MMGHWRFTQRNLKVGLAKLIAARCEILGGACAKLRCWKGAKLRCWKVNTILHNIQMPRARAHQKCTFELVV